MISAPSRTHAGLGCPLHPSPSYVQRAHVGIKLGSQPRLAWKQVRLLLI